MSLANWSKPGEGTRRVETPAPVLTLPAEAGGLRGDRLVVLQVGISMKNGKVRGIAHNKSIGLIRLEATRLVELGDASHEIELGERRDAWVERGYEDVLFRQRIARATEDDSLRPEGRVSLVIRKAGPGAMAPASRAGWRAAVNEVIAGLDWAVSEATLWRGNQYALLLACELQDVRRVTPKDPRYGEFTEATVTMIRAAEVVKLADPDGSAGRESGGGARSQSEDEDDELEQAALGRMRIK